MRINYRSDFDFYIRLFDSEGKPVDVSKGIAVDVMLTTGMHDEIDDDEWCPKLAGFGQNGLGFNAHYDVDNADHCFFDGKKLHIIVDNHSLKPGRLCIELSIKLPRDIYPDGSQRIVEKKETFIELVGHRGDIWTGTPTIDLYLPIVAKATESGLCVELITDSATYRIPLSVSGIERIPVPGGYNSANDFQLGEWSI